MHTKANRNKITMKYRKIKEEGFGFLCDRGLCGSAMGRRDRKKSIEVKDGTKSRIVACRWLPLWCRRPHPGLFSHSPISRVPVILSWIIWIFIMQSHCPIAKALSSKHSAPDEVAPFLRVLTDVSLYGTFKTYKSVTKKTLEFFIQVFKAAKYI